MRVAHSWVTCEARRWTAAVQHPGVKETVVQATKAAKPSHSAAAALWDMLCGQAEVVEKKEGARDADSPW